MKMSSNDAVTLEEEDLTLAHTHTDYLEADGWRLPVIP